MYYFCLVLKVKQVISEIFILYFIVFKTDIRTFNTIYIYKFTKQRKIFIHPLSKKTKTKTNNPSIFEEMKFTLLLLATLEYVMF